MYAILLAINCPEDMVYQQCGQACPQTCDTEENEDCVGSCAEGCFCQSGKVLWNGKCINSSECAGIQALHNNILNYYIYTVYIYTHTHM